MFLLFIAIPAQAAHRHHHSHHVHAYRSHHRSEAWSGTGGKHHRHHHYASHGQSSGGVRTVSTAAGPITVASSLAGRFQALIADFAAHGYKPRHIGCFAHGGHVPNSRHYAGAACDFDQHGWGKTVSFMYHAHAIIARHGLNDGCSFNDCGHVDDGHRVRYAQRWHGSRYGG